MKKVEQLKHNLIQDLIKLGNQEEVIDDIIDYMLNRVYLGEDPVIVLDDMELSSEYKDLLLIL